jgi:hypothetical protein
MRSQLLTLTLVGILGALLASDARACHRVKCAPRCAPPAPVCCEQAPAPCPPPAPVCAAPVARKCCMPRINLSCHLPKIKMPSLCCHRRPACPPAPCAAAPVVYAAPQVAPSPQVHPSGQ